MVKRTTITQIFVACALVGLVSACSHERVVTEQTRVESVPSIPVRQPAAEVVVQQAPPSARAEVRPPSPSSAYVWVPGYWTWGMDAWAWVPGRWEMPPERTATWVPGQWIQRGSAWAWRDGHWE
ncbi:MAG: YXWGXW repeat-containing protein [Candidatus Tectimicrobiota bacterium]